MTTLPVKRHCHITRIFGEDRKGNIIPELWVDMLRSDKIKFVTQDIVHVFKTEINVQDVTVNLNWKDDVMFGDPGEIEGPNVSIVKICDPNSESLEDPDEFIRVRNIKKFKLTADNSRGGVRTTRKFLDSLLSTSNKNRIFENRRFFHYDTNIDAEAQKVAEAGYKSFVYKDAQSYDLDLTTKDEEQYLEHEVVTKCKSLATRHWVEANGDDQDTFIRLRNQYLLDFSGEAELDEVGILGRNPPYRFDPFQNIVNCSLGGLAVEFFDKAGSK